MPDNFDLDINALITAKIIGQGGTIEDFEKIDKLITEYSQRSGMPEDGIAMIILDCIDGGFSKEHVETQLRVYDSKGHGPLVM